MQVRDFLGRLPVGRREFVAGSLLAIASIASRAAAANAIIGAADEVRGTVSRKIGGKNAPIHAGADIMDRDFIITGEESFAALTLGSDTKLLLGSQTQLLVDSFIAGQGGTIELGTGRLIFDRPQGAPKLDLALRTAFGMIGVRGTKFFAGPNRGAFAVFVEHGSVDVTGGGVTRRVGAGEGVDIAAPGAAPGPVRRWGQARISEAYASVGVR
ncbi:hypothetical protein J2Y48_000274 [Mycoplana sp. BE70]|nr:hypothetical protein [Mycoplana sp. BE70]